MTHAFLPLRPGDLARLIRCSVIWLEGIGRQCRVEVEYGDLMLVLASDVDDCRVLLLTVDGRVGWLRRPEPDALTAWLERIASV